MGVPYHVYPILTLAGQNLAVQQQIAVQPQPPAEILHESVADEPVEDDSLSLAARRQPRPRKLPKRFVDDIPQPLAPPVPFTSHVAVLYSPPPVLADSVRTPHGLHTFIHFQKFICQSPTQIRTDSARTQHGLSTDCPEYHCIKYFSLLSTQSSVPSTISILSPSS
jgi:hypothetical protein